MRYDVMWCAVWCGVGTAERYSGVCGVGWRGVVWDG